MDLNILVLWPRAQHAFGMTHVALDGWEKTLRGEAADLCARWEHDLKPKRFGLDARVVTFENDRVADFGLYPLGRVSIHKNSFS